MAMDSGPAMDSGAPTDGGDTPAISGTGTLVEQQTSTSRFMAGSYTLDDRVSSTLVYGQSTRTSVQGFLTRIDIQLSATHTFAATCSGTEDQMSPGGVDWSYSVNTTSSEVSHSPSQAGDLVTDAEAGRLTLIRNGTHYTYELQLNIPAARVTSYTAHETQSVPCQGGGATVTAHEGTITSQTTTDTACDGTMMTSTEQVERSVGSPEFGGMVASGEFDPAAGDIDKVMNGENDSCSLTYCLPGGTSKVGLDLGVCHNSFSGHIHLPFDQRWLQ